MISEYFVWLKIKLKRSGFYPERFVVSVFSSQAVYYVCPLRLLRRRCVFMLAPTPVLKAKGIV